MLGCDAPFGFEAEVAADLMSVLGENRLGIGQAD